MGEERGRGKGPKWVGTVRIDTVRIDDAVRIDNTVRIDTIPYRDGRDGREGWTRERLGTR